MPDANEIHNMSEINELMKAFVQEHEPKVVDDELRQQLANIERIEKAFSKHDEKSEYVSPFVGTEGILNKSEELVDLMADQEDEKLEVLDGKNALKHVTMNQKVNECDQNIEAYKSLDEDKRKELEAEIAKSLTTKRLKESAGANPRVDRLKNILASLQQARLAVVESEIAIKALMEELETKD